MNSKLVVAALSLLVLFGCRSGPNLPATVPAEGTVTLDGQPVGEATVLLIADVGNYNASAITDKDGKFKLSTAFAEGDKLGAVPGSYKITISKTVVEQATTKGGESGANVKYGVPVKYSTIGTSGFTLTLSDKGDKEIKLDMKSK